MPAFAVTAPHLSREQHYELEDLLLGISGVDAFFNEEGVLGTEVTCPIAALPRVVACVYDWAAAHERGSSAVQITCAGGVAALVDHDQGEIVVFLATCSDDASDFQGLTKRLADDGVHEGR